MAIVPEIFYVMIFPTICRFIETAAITLVGW